MTSPDLKPLVPELVAIARRASQEILQIYDKSFAVRDKADASPLTEADEASEALILSSLRTLTPDIPAFGEEAVSRGEANADSLPPRYWLVDPLDGTREFAAERPHYAVCIGLVVGAAPVLGVVALPATGEVFAGGTGLGAWKQDAGGRRDIRARTVPEAGATVLTGRHRGDDPRIPPFLAQHRVADVQAFGSAEKFCRVAEGAADLYPRFGRTYEWDTAAGHALVEAAGGQVATFAGAPLRYGKPGFENPDFLVRGA